MHGSIPIHVPRDVDDNDQREEEPKDVNLNHHQQHKGAAEIGKAGHDLLRSGGAEMFAMHKQPDTKNRVQSATRGYDGGITGAKWEYGVADRWSQRTL